MESRKYSVYSHKNPRPTAQFVVNKVEKFYYESKQEAVDDPLDFAFYFLKDGRTLFLWVTHEQTLLYPWGPIMNAS